jgi:predicted neuraminidase
MSPLLMALVVAAGAGESPLQSRLIFAPHPQHNHGSCIVECPNGDLLVCWYRGSGERTADDVRVLGARLRKGSRHWSSPFVMADTPGFPDCNPCMVIDRRRRLWLFWPTILANLWETALLKYRVSDAFQGRTGAPRWTRGDTVPIRPGPEFASAVRAGLATAWSPYLPQASADDAARLRTYIADRITRAGDKLTVRLGWMPRAHPSVLNDGRMLLPLYSDLFDFSLIAISDDDGDTWECSDPIIGAGNVQPSIAERRDGTLVAYFRDNGPPPQRVIESTSSDRGQTWSTPKDIGLPDPGAGLEVLVLRSGRWILVNNDTEEGRHSLAVSVSDDEGRSWLRKRHLEHDQPGPEAGSYGYPSVLQSQDGTVHVTYTHRPSAARAKAEGAGSAIRHAWFREGWLLSGEPIASVAGPAR